MNRVLVLLYAVAFGSSMPYISMFTIGVILPVLILSKREPRKQP